MSVQNADHQADIIIVGGGLSGLTLACALGTAGVSTLVIPSAQASVKIGRAHV